VRALLILLLVSAASTAAADPMAPPFSSLDRTAGESGAGADVAVQQFDDEDYDGGIVDDDHAVRIDLHGEYALSNRFGIVGSFTATKRPASARRTSVATAAWRSPRATSSSSGSASSCRPRPTYRTAPSWMK
jgi:opacity protein-like surface antigen